MHDGSSQLVNAVLLLLGEAQDIKSFLKYHIFFGLVMNYVQVFKEIIFFNYISSHQLLCIINGGYGCLSLGDIGVIIGVVGD